MTQEASVGIEEGLRALEARAAEVDQQIGSLEAGLSALRSERDRLRRAIEILAPPTDQITTTLVRSHAGKYRRLWEWLQRQTAEPVCTTFDGIEAVLGFPLPPSSRRHPPHWYGYEGSAVARAIRDAGFRTRHVDLAAETVEFHRLGSDEGGRTQ